MSTCRRRHIPSAFLLLLLAAAALLALVACSTTDEQTDLSAARLALPGVLKAARCDYDDTIANRPAVQGACNDARYACYGGSTPETLPTAKGCRAALDSLEAVSEMPRTEEGPPTP